MRKHTFMKETYMAEQRAYKENYAERVVLQKIEFRNAPALKRPWTLAKDRVASFKPKWTEIQDSMLDAELHVVRNAVCQRES